MKLLMLCGYFAKENEQEVMEHARAQVEFSANLFQQKLIRGFRELNADIDVLSAPFIGSYPNASDIMVFRGFRHPQNECRYVPFVNVWGIRNISRTVSLKKAVRSFIAADDDEKLIVVYCPHTPFLEAAVYAKKRDPRIRICLYVPDLPQYMNLNPHRSWLYDFAKKYDVAAMTKLMDHVDSYILLTEPMKDALPVGDKPYRIIEGIVAELEEPAEDTGEESPEKYIVYTGKLNEKFGVKNLIDAFGLIHDPDFRLVLCGRGDCDSYAAEAAGKDRRIMVMGQVTPGEARHWQRSAAVLVNPRWGNEDFIQYSFASKNIEYLLTGKPVVAYMLPGMPEYYQDFIYQIDPDMDPNQAIARAINRALQSTENEKGSFIEYAEKKLLAGNIARAIINLVPDVRGS